MPEAASVPITLSRRVYGHGAQSATIKTGPASEPDGGWLGELRHALGDRLITPGDGNYDGRRRVFDARFDFRPQAIALCASERDVRACLTAAQANAVAFRIRGGGHSFSGASGCDGMIIDVAGLDDAAIHGHSVTVGGGCSQGKLAQLLNAAQLSVPIGDWETVCLGGFMQGGGFGGLSRTFGLNSDHVDAVRVMLADGRVVRADQHTNHDLWWAVRGGTGNNFGVLLDITYRLRPAPAVAALLVAFSLAAPLREQAVAALGAYQAGFMVGGAPDTVNSSAMICRTIPPAPDGQWLVIEVIQVGTQAELAASAQPLLALPGAISGFDTDPLVPPDPMPPFARASRLIERAITADEWRGLLGLMEESPNRLTKLYLKAHGGAINAVPRTASAFVHRKAHCNMFMDVFWVTPADQAPAEAFRARWRRFVERLGDGHIYQNFPEPDAPDYTANYWGDAYPGLAAVKAKYDPANAFRHPQSIMPGAARAVSWPPRVIEALAHPIVTSE